MPFGKYRKWEVEGLPTDYLEWLRDNVEDLRGRLRAAVLDELDRRYYTQDAWRDYERDSWRQEAPRRTTAGVVIEIHPDDISLAREVVDCGYRTAARAHHPDVGGNPQTMVRLNALVESLRAQLQAVAR